MISIFIRLGWILFWPDTWYQLIFNAGYLANVRYPANYRISSIINQPDIRYPDSFNIQYPAGYWNCRISGPTLIFINIFFSCCCKYKAHKPEGVLYNDVGESCHAQICTGHHFIPVNTVGLLSTYDCKWFMSTTCFLNKVIMAYIISTYRKQKNNIDIIKT